MSQPRIVLGKRPRRSTRSAQLTMDDVEAPPKRSRARRSECEASAAAEPRNGLLTPQASVLTESQGQIPMLQASKEPGVDVEARHEDVYDRATTFPFMKLPAELRLHIYHMALVRPLALNLHTTRLPDTTPESPPSPSAPARAPLQPVQMFSSASRRTPRATSPPHSHPVYPSDPVVPVILRLNKQIHKEARQLLYAENVFTLTLASGIHTLSTLHQRSRSLIKHVVLTIPSHHDILDGFADLVRLGLRYCWGLKSFKIILHASLPDDGRVGGATSVYANAFHILRWLPRGCSVVLEGSVSETVRRVVLEEGRLMTVLDERSYLKRQHQMPERH